MDRDSVLITQDEYNKFRNASMDAHEFGKAIERLQAQLDAEDKEIERLQRNIEALKFTGNELMEQLADEEMPSWVFRATERHRKNLEGV